MRLFSSPAHGATRRTFADRREAGRVLADALTSYRDVPDVLVLGLPRGGVPVAWEVAAALHAPLDVLVVRKLGAPRWEELAIGALASGGLVVRNEDVLRSMHITEEQIQQVIEREAAELARREAAYRGGRAPIEPAGKTIILVDDGIATGATMLAAARAIRAAGPQEIVAAIPVAAPSGLDQLQRAADEVVCVCAPMSFMAVGEYYEDFSQTSDDEVRSLLATPTAG